MQFYDGITNEQSRLAELNGKIQMKHDERIRATTHLLSCYEESSEVRAKANSMAAICAGFNGFAVVAKLLTLLIVAFGEDKDSTNEGVSGVGSRLFPSRIDRSTN